MRRLVELVFFGNIYIGVLAVLLSVETAFQLHLPLCPLGYYVLLFGVTAGYYTYAYSWLPQQYRSDNPRARWYLGHRRLVNRLLVVYMGLAAVSLVGLLVCYGSRLSHVGADFGIVLVAMLLSGIFYYGILPQSFFNLRHTGWLKAFTIGFTWACCVSFMPILVGRWTSGIVPGREVAAWFFLKNFMFCSLNAIMFDIKDYEDDTNRQLKTFVVRFGIYRTIYFVLLPLVLVGLTAFCTFAWQTRMPLPTFLFNLLPFLLTFFIVLSLNRSKPLLYYLIVIDGILIFKAVCGILGVWIISH
ncbi:MAG: UbiA family prenyltransferase [Chitinophagaceae bacterium]